VGGADVEGGGAVESTGAHRAATRHRCFYRTPLSPPTGRVPDAGGRGGKEGGGGGGASGGGGDGSAGRGRVGGRGGGEERHSALESKFKSPSTTSTPSNPTPRPSSPSPQSLQGLPLSTAPRLAAGAESSARLEREGDMRREAAEMARAAAEEESRREVAERLLRDGPGVPHPPARWRSGGHTVGVMG